MTTVVVGTAGHIDHGKSAVIRALTGTDPDRLKEEQVRGITIDLGFAHLVAGDVQIAFVDVPGHERFVRNMLAGAGGIDAVLLVVAANEGVKPQTREHFEICRLLGLPRGVIVLTKSDVADAGMVAAATAEIGELVAGSFLEGAPIVPVSSITGDGLDALRAALVGLAGHGARLHRPGVVRLPIDRVFSVKGFGTVVTGTLVSGRVSVNDALAVLPDGVAVRVRGLQVHGRSATSADAPLRLAVNLTGVAATQLHRGLTLVTPGSLAATPRSDVHVQLLKASRPLAHGARVRVHSGTMETFARLSIGATRATATADWTPAHPGDARVDVPAGGEAFARLRFESPVVVTRGDRLILRAVSPVETIGGARVLDPMPASGGVRRESMAARYRLLDAADTGPIIDWMIADAAVRGLDASALVRRAGLTPDQAAAELSTRVAAGRAVSAGGRVFARAIVNDLAARARAEIQKFHEAQPDEPGIPRETLRSRTGRRVGADVFDAVVAALTAAGAIKGTERIALASHTPRETAGGAGARDRIEARLLAAGLTPPDAVQLGVDEAVPEPDVQRIIRGLIQDGRLVRIGDLVFHREALGALRAAVTRLREGQPPGARITLDVPGFKAQHGLSRKFAIPLLEWLDRERVTRRIGDVRVVL
jgi:selenocysteine-specific elongation factor